MYWVVYCIAMYGCMAVLDVLRCIAALLYTGRGTGQVRCIDQYSTFLRCIAAERAALDSCCIARRRALVAHMLPFSTLPEELQGGCARFLDTTSAGRFSQASRACWRLVDEQLVAAKAARAAKLFESKYGGIVTYRNSNDDSKLFTFSGTGGGHFMCSCALGNDGSPKEYDVGRTFSNVARHLASRKHWRHWRLVAFGEAHPTEAAWQAFAAST